MSEQHPPAGTYYVPAYSRLPIFVALGLFCTMYGFIQYLHGNGFGTIISVIGAVILAGAIFFWFREVVLENFSQAADPQLDRSYRWGMVWFIFSEVMFFGIFFFALFYLRLFSVPELGGEVGLPSSTLTHILLWPNFQASWPLIQNPNNVAFPGAKVAMGAIGIPALNTLILLTSALTVTWAHWGLKRNRRKQLISGLMLTIALGVSFLVLQGHEYLVAYTLSDLKLSAGVYGSTFFMLTGFHGLHVTIGAVMLLVILVRCLRGHFTPEEHFGFEATAWYWHFVDVVWLCLFIFVYWM